MNKAQQSKQYISEALLRLLCVKDYCKITIQDIVDEAQVSRMAFYRNYDSKAQIIKEYLDWITDEFMKTTKIDYSVTEQQEYFELLISHLVDYKEIGMILVKAGLFDFLRDEFNRVYVSKAKSEQEMYSYCFLAGGVCNVYYYWLKNGCRASKQELADILRGVLR